MRCLVKNCRNNPAKKVQGISYHKLPRRSDTKALWLRKLGFDQTKVLSSNSIVCSEHFDDKCFLPRMTGDQKKFLKRTAVPTLLVDVPECDIIEKEIPDQLPFIERTQNMLIEFLNEDEISRELDDRPTTPNECSYTLSNDSSLIQRELEFARDNKTHCNCTDQIIYLKNAQLRIEKNQERMERKIDKLCNLVKAMSKRNGPKLKK